jgi:hypothetical protein
MRHRLLVASLSLLLALTCVALPANGTPPPAGTATVTVAQGQGCSVEVTYTWSGFRGSDLRAQLGVTWPAGGMAEWRLLFESPPVTGSGMSSHTFDVSDFGSNTYGGFGNLSTSKGKVLTGSDVRSTTSADVIC